MALKFYTFPLCVNIFRGKKWQMQEIIVIKGYHIFSSLLVSSVIKMEVFMAMKQRFSIT